MVTFLLKVNLETEIILRKTAIFYFPLLLQQYCLYLLFLGHFRFLETRPFVNKSKNNRNNRLHFF